MAPSTSPKLFLLEVPILRPAPTGIHSKSNLNFLLVFRLLFWSNHFDSCFQYLMITLGIPVLTQVPPGRGKMAIVALIGVEVIFN